MSWHWASWAQSVAAEQEHRQVPEPSEFPSYLVVWKTLPVVSGCLYGVEPPLPSLALLGNRPLYSCQPVLRPELAVRPAERWIEQSCSLVADCPVGYSLIPD